MIKRKKHPKAETTLDIWPNNLRQQINGQNIETVDKIRTNQKCCTKYQTAVN